MIETMLYHNPILSNLIIFLFQLEELTRTHTVSKCSIRQTMTLSILGWLFDHLPSWLSSDHFLTMSGSLY